MPKLLDLTQYFTTTLSKAGGLNTSETTGIVLQSISGVEDATKPGILCLSYSDPLDSSTAEWIYYESIDAGTKELQGVVRGQEGSSAKTHNNGATIAFVLSQTHLKRMRAAILKVYDETADAAYVSPTGWTPSSDTWTYVSATSFKITGADRTTTYTKGTKIKLTQTTAKYFVVTSSSFSTDTTINITAGSDYTLANAAITSPYYSLVENPEGYPGTFAYTPTVTAEAGSYVSVTPTGKFRVVGKTCTVTGKITLTTIGTGANAMDVTPPITADSTNYFVSAWIDSGNTASGGFTTATNMKIKKYDNTHPGTSGNVIYFSAIFDF